MEFTKVYTVKKEVSEQEFLRSVLIGLSKDESSPSNIMKAKFGKVTEFQSQIFITVADVEVNYSGSCGYDREEQYQTTERKYVSEGDYYICNGVQRRATRSGSVEVDAIKTRIVTDWHPHSGTIKTSKASFSLNEEGGDNDLASLFPKAIEEASDDSLIEEGTASLNASAYEQAIEDCEEKATWEIDWPGDHHKNERYTCKTDVKEVECFIVPCYMVEYEYNGRKYRARGLAIGKANEVHQVPKADGKVESINTIENRRKINVREAEKPLKIAKLSIVFTVIMALVALYGLMFAGEATAGGEVCLPIGLIGMAIFIAIAVIINVIVKKKVENINILANIQKKKLNNIKVDNLVEALKKLNLPTLSAMERSAIMGSIK